MKIGRKIIIGYFFIVFFTVLVGVFSSWEIRKVRSEFADTSRYAVDIIKALNDIKEAGYGIILFTNKYGFISLERKAVNNPEENQVGEEYSLIDREKILFDQGIKHYQITARQICFAEECYRVEIIAESIINQVQELLTISDQIIKEKNANQYGQPLFELNEKFEKAERDFFEIINDTIDHELSELEQKNAQIAASSNRAILTILLICGISLVLALLNGLKTARSISRPINLLKDASAHIGMGELETRLNLPEDNELGELGASFNKMVDDLKNFNKQLIYEKKYNDRIFHAISETLMVVSHEGTVLRANRPLCELTGYSKRELIGMRVELVIENWEVIAGKEREIMGQGFVQNLEAIYRTNRGDNIPMQLSVSALKDHDGGFQAFLYVARDISERKDASICVA